MTLTGIDGCKAGWVVATADENLRDLPFNLVTHFKEARTNIAGDGLSSITFW